MDSNLFDVDVEYPSLACTDEEPIGVVDIDLVCVGSAMKLKQQRQIRDVLLAQVQQFRALLVHGRRQAKAAARTAEWLEHERIVEAERNLVAAGWTLFAQRTFVDRTRSRLPHLEERRVETVVETLRTPTKVAVRAQDASWQDFVQKRAPDPGCRDAEHVGKLVKIEDSGVAQVNVGLDADFAALS